MTNGLERFPTTAKDLVRRERCPICRGRHRPATVVDSMHYVRCRGCGLTFMEPMPSQDWYFQRYEAEYWQGRAKLADDHDETIRKLRKEHLRALAYREALQRHPGLPTQGVLLEVGCGTGGAVATLAASLGWAAFGVEPDGDSRLVASRIGVSVDETDLEGLAAKGRRFDVILLSHVLEHVVDPQQFLSTITRVLAEDGLLLIEVPNGLTNESLHLFHPYLFTRRALTELLAQHGLHADVTAHGGAASRMRHHYLLATATRSPDPIVRGARRGFRPGRAWSRAWKRGRVLPRIDRMLVQRAATADEELLERWQMHLRTDPDAGEP